MEKEPCDERPRAAKPRGANKIRDLQLSTPGEAALTVRAVLDVDVSGLTLECPPSESLSETEMGSQGSEIGEDTDESVFSPTTSPLSWRIGEVASWMVSLEPALARPCACDTDMWNLVPLVGLVYSCIGKSLGITFTYFYVLLQYQKL